MSSQVGEPVQCFMGSVIPADRHEVGERLPSHRETPPLRAGPSPQGARSSVAASHLVLGSQGVEAEVGSRGVPLPAHFHPS